MLYPRSLSAFFLSLSYLFVNEQRKSLEKASKRYVGFSLLEISHAGTRGWHFIVYIIIATAEHILGDEYFQYVIFPGPKSTLEVFLYENKRLIGLNQNVAV